MLTNLGSEFYSEKKIAEGTFGQIYQIESENKKYALKCISLNNNKNLQPNLNPIYKQYLFSLLANEYEIGPKVYKLFGYDLIVTKNQAMFVMELCETVKENEIQIIEKQLKNNLQIMHSLKMVHLDIKIQNIAFSLFYNKYIFLDFGVSHFIEQQIGYKTLITFIGTLSYCSQEMKKSYLLRKPSYIDLYYNDLIAYKKTIKYLNSMKVNKNNVQNDFVVNNIIMKKNIVSQNKKQNVCRVSKMDMYSESLIVFEVKFYLFKKYYENLFALLESNKYKTSNVLYTIFMILNFIKNQVNKNKKLQSLLQKIKSKIIECQNFKSNTDYILSNYFVKMQQKQSKFELVSLSHFLRLNNELLKQKIKEINWIYKLFIYINPFSKLNENQIFIINEQKYQRKIIIQKLCNILNYNSENPLFYMKVRFVLIFIYKSLLPLKNLQLLYSFRMIFIMIQDLLHVQLVEEQIISIIKNNNKNILFILKITQFYFFWHRINSNYYKFQKWINLINQKQIQENNFVELKIKNSIIDIMKKLKMEQRNLIKFDQFIISVLEQCQLLSLSSEQNQTFHLIKCIYLRRYDEKTIYRKNQKKLKIYFNIFHNVQFCNIRIDPRDMISFTDIQYHVNMASDWESQLYPRSYVQSYDIFQFLTEVFNRNWINKDYRIAFRQNINCIIQLYDKNISLIPINMLEYLYHCAKIDAYDKNIFIQFIKLLLAILVKEFQNKIIYTLYDLGYFRTYICYILVFMKFMLKKQNPQLKISLQQTKQLKQQIGYCINTINNTSFKAINSLKNSFQIMSKTAQNYLQSIFCKQNNLKQRIKCLQQIYKLYKGDEIESIQQKTLIKTLFYENLKYIQEKESFDNEILKKINVNIAQNVQSQIQSRYFYWKAPLIIKYIIIKCSQKKGLVAYNYIVVLFRLIFAHRISSNYYVTPFNIVNIASAFLHLISDDQIERIYLTYINRDDISTSINQPIILLHFIMFCRIFKNLDFSIKLKQLIKIQRSLQFMETQFRIRIKPIFFRTCRKMKIFKNMRKQIKLMRIQMKAVFENNFDMFRKIIQKQICKFQKCVVAEALQQKIDKLQRNIIYTLVNQKYPNN